MASTKFSTLSVWLPPHPTICPGSLNCCCCWKPSPRLPFTGGGGGHEQCGHTNWQTNFFGLFPSPQLIFLIVPELAVLEKNPQISSKCSIPVQVVFSIIESYKSRSAILRQQNNWIREQFNRMHEYFFRRVAGKLCEEPVPKIAKPRPIPVWFWPPEGQNQGCTSWN